jgi:hypothetical protein
MAKQTKRKRILRDDLVEPYLPGVFKGKANKAYTWMRKVKEGQFPPGNTNVAKALAAVEVALIKDLGQLNAAQQVQLNLMRPLLVWWMLHPGTVGDDGHLAHDFKWIHSQIQDGLRRLIDLGDKIDRPVQSLEDYLKKCKSEEVENRQVD